MTQAQSPRTQDERSSAARRALIGATIQVLATEGYGRTTFTRIQKVAGVSRGLIGYHFGTKEALFEAVVHAIRDSSIDVAPSEARRETSGMQQLEEMVDLYIARLARDPKPAQTILTLTMHSVDDSPGILDAIQMRYQEMRDKIANCIRTGQRDGTIVDEVDPDALATVVQGMLGGIAMQVVVDPQHLHIDTVREAARTTLRSIATNAAS
ncbi:TetR/AcrR family transcriptional regulator [Rhodococcus sp. NPDC057014]|uniref:TetR/AcrR family transcriptional regulator n=1 Tax=Rhodococcus sp. NPDC057014 TaxID=3346000 RepID=UPI0036414678